MDLENQDFFDTRENSHTLTNNKSLILISLGANI